MRRALAEYEIAGIKTTLPFHRELFVNPDFLAGDIETRFLERKFLPGLAEGADGNAALLVATLLSHERQRGGWGGAQAAAGEQRSGWRLAARLGRSTRGGPWRNTP